VATLLKEARKGNQDAAGGEGLIGRKGGENQENDSNNLEEKRKS